jgi:hypothetical protein
MSSFRGRLFLILCLLHLGGQAVCAEPDRPEQPLPAGAVARFGKGGATSTNTTYGLRFGPDGSWLVIADSSSEVRLWDRSTGKPIRSFRVGDRALIGSAALSADGRLLAAQTMNGPTRATLHVWEVESGRELWHRDTTDLNVSDLCFSPDGRTLVLAADRTVCLWNTITAKEIRSNLFGTETVLVVTCSPDGKRMAGGDRAGEVRVWDLASGQLVRQLSPPPRSGTFYAVRSLRFSPDSALLTCGQNSQVLIWETAGWQEVGKLGDHAGAVFDLAFAPDGHTLATACHDHKVRLWEVATWQKRKQFEGHRGLVYRTAFSPNGRTVASGSSDGEVLLWDVTGQATQPARPTKPLSEDKIEALWRELQGRDGAAAYRAVWELASAPGQSVPFLKERLVPATDGSAQIEQWLADLVAEDFAVRQQASAGLARLGKAAQPVLRRALTEPATAEERKRIEDLEFRKRVGELLEKLESATPAPEQLATTRTLEVLEILGTPEARAVLQTLAGGATGAPLTEEAKAALTRLNRSPRSDP